MTKAINMEGRRFGRLMVIARCGANKQNGNVKWKCRCDCGSYCERDGYLLRKGRSTNCGCVARENKRGRIHTMTHHVAVIDDRNIVVNGYGAKLVKRGRKNHSGVTGVSYESRTNRWIARLMYEGHLVLNARFQNFDDAVIARKKAEDYYLGGLHSFRLVQVRKGRIVRPCVTKRYSAVVGLRHPRHMTIHKPSA